ncbi:MAG TPA: hypothetical protein VIK39_01235 [Candidatus Angelobacter sp.]|jgi:hypothetical protein
MNTVQESIHRVSEALLNGAKLPLTVTNDDKTVNIQLRESVKANLPVFDRVYMDRCEKGYSEGFDAALGGKLQFAKEAFAMADAILESKPLFYESRLLSKAFLRAAQAYLDYAVKDFIQARNRLQEAMQCDEILETKFGYTILHIHRVHLVENIMRSEFQAGRKCEAFALAQALLLYLAGINQELPIPGKWGQELLGKIAPKILHSKLVGITADMAQYLAFMDPIVAREFFLLVAAPLNSGNPEFLQADVLEWFVLKEMYLNGAPADFLSRASEFLAQGPRAVPALWAAVTLDVVVACEALPDSEMARKQILAGAVNWGFIPRKLRPQFLEKASELNLIVRPASASDQLTLG